MKTFEVLKDVEFDSYFQREMNQEAELKDQKINVNKSTSYLFNFISSGHPSDIKGLWVVVVDNNEVVEIDKDYVKSIFGIGSLNPFNNSSNYGK